MARRGDALRALALAGDPLVYDVAAAILGEIRKAKTEVKRNLRTEVELVVVHDVAGRINALRAAQGDVQEAGRVAAFELVTVADAADASITVTLAPETDG